MGKSGVGIFLGMAPVSKAVKKKESPAGIPPATDRRIWRTVDQAIPSKVASPQSFGPLRLTPQAYQTRLPTYTFGHGSHA